MKRKNLITCDSCKGDCCTGIALEIPTPRTKEDYEDIRWYLYHERTHVYIDHEGDWIAEMDLACGQRDPATGRCKIYRKRPPACRDAKLSECERNIDDAKVRFRTVEEYDGWLGRRAK